MGCAAPHPLHWEDLRSRSREQILGRDGVRVRTDGKGYEVDFLNSVCLVDPVAERIVELSPNPGRELPEEFQILLIRYLVAENGGPLEDKEVSQKDFPGGVTFFQGPHTLNVAPIAKLYGRDPEAFEMSRPRTRRSSCTAWGQGHALPPVSSHARHLRTLERR